MEHVHKRSWHFWPKSQTDDRLRVDFLLFADQVGLYTLSYFDQGTHYAKLGKEERHTQLRTPGRW